ncbi:MAG TPA: DUF3344 domain-containing protein, partial [Methanolinea sp.]|nr:DUF3344 domain-containing protein [Methanolinea sp.]HRU80807.1 DUF3344 domain-containing protein [Methanolinea sp.]
MYSIFRFEKWPLSVILMVTLILCFFQGVQGDSYVGGIPLVTVQSGTVTGDLWMDIAPAPDWGSTNVVKTFSLPAEAVGNITWARLYVSAYCGHMQNNYAFSITNRFDGNGDGTYEKTWAEPATSSPSVSLPVSFTYMDNGGNDNSAFPGHGTGEPYKMINDHMNRVTSDYFMWYDVTNMISSPTVNVNVVTTGSSDGRIKVISLLVAYDQPGSNTKTLYWVNQGHDVCSYYTEDNYGEAAVGSTTFGTAGISDVDSATLYIEYLASNNGNYGFPTADNTFAYTGGTPPVEGSFTHPLDRDPDVQGPYSGVDSWDVTSDLTGNDVTFAYARYFPGTGTAAFYKIPLAILVAKRQNQQDAPVAAFTATPTSGNSPLEVSFTDQSTGTITSWAWDFDSDGTVDSTDQNPVHTYQTAGTYTVTLTVTGAGGSDSEVKTSYIMAKCNLVIQGVLNPRASNVFAFEPNTLQISNVRNTVGNSPETEIEVKASDGWTGRVTVAPMNATGSQTVTIIDPTIRTAEGTVTYTYRIDPDNLVPETDETANQNKTIDKPVRFNGYKSTDYWAGKERVRTYLVFDIRGDIIHSFGDSKYKSGSFGSGWYNDTATWTAGDLPVPDGAGIVAARLYIPYCWDHENEVGGGTTTTTFNGVTVSPAHWEEDTSNFGAYADYRYGLLTYNVTGLYRKNEINTATFTRSIFSGKLSPAGFTLAVVYADPNASRKQIFVNEGWDLLGASEGDYATNETEAAAFQAFSGMTIDMAHADVANLTTFVPWGAPQKEGDPGEGNLFVNGVQVGTNVWNYGERAVGESDSPQVAVDTRDILAYLNPSGSGNSIAIQSTTGGSPSMVAERSFLVVEYHDDLPVADFSANVTSGQAPLVVQFTDASTGYVTSYEWDLDGDGVTDSTDKNPVWIYSSPGTYSVRLTVTNSAGSDTKEKSSYITSGGTGSPDLVITSITTNADELFASEPNAISATVLNNG